MRKDGILQIVDRGERSDEPERIEETFEVHWDQASTTSLTVEVVDSFDYEEPSDGGSQPMVVTLGTSGRLPTNLDMSL